MRNIELKLRLHDPELARRACARLGAVPMGVLLQTDTYYRVPGGRAKRRDTVGRPTEFVVYQRADDAVARASEYDLLDEAGFLARVGPVLPEPWIVVRKARDLHLIDDARIHLDEVEGLGSFCEFEVVMVPGRSSDAAHALLERLLAALSPALGEPIAQSYSDLLASGMAAPGQGAGSMRKMPPSTSSVRT